MNSDGSLDFWNATTRDAPGQLPKDNEKGSVRSLVSYRLSDFPTSPAAPFAMPVHIYQPLKQSEDDSGAYITHWRWKNNWQPVSQCYLDMPTTDVENGGERAFQTPSRPRASVNESQILDEHTQEELDRERDAHAGVQRVEAAKKVYGRSSKWILFISWEGSFLSLIFMLMLL